MLLVPDYGGEWKIQPNYEMIHFRFSVLRIFHSSYFPTIDWSFFGCVSMKIICHMCCIPNCILAWIAFVVVFLTPSHGDETVLQISPRVRTSVAGSTGNVADQTSLQRDSNATNPSAF